jgi:hypothetical protein
LKFIFDLGFEGGIFRFFFGWGLNYFTVEILQGFLGLGLKSEIINFVD